MNPGSADRSNPTESPRALHNGGGRADPARQSENNGQNMLNWKLLGSAAVSAVAMTVTLALMHDENPAAADPSPAEPGSSDVTGEETRIAAGATLDSLMGLLDREVEERLRLQEQVDDLALRLARLEAPEPPAGRSRDDAGTRPPDRTQDPDAPRELTEAALRAAGFSDTEAAYYRRRYDETAMAQLYLRDQAEREGWIGTPRYFEALRDVRQGLDSLRDEMGEDAYARYLYALGQPNRVAVNRVLGGSAAQAAGLQAGDVILRYDGVRVYGAADVRRRTRAGNPGETVTVDILRDGNRIQAYLPRGPLGVSMSSESLLVTDDT
jgi:hypothetical protein